MKRLLAVCIATLLVACAATIVRPQQGAAVAQVNDLSTAGDDESNSRVFAVRKIDGVSVRNAIDNQRRIGAGAGILPWLVAREVEARRTTFLIGGRFVTPAPIDAIVRSVWGKIQTVEGLVTFTPRADRIYRVNGVLTPSESAVWIEDFETGEVVTGKVIAP